ncbi:MAG: GGDEF domain-containing response regulator [Legionella sp.]|nr:GGDEF domain-containing response regulator [Legionella sp.]
MNQNIINVLLINSNKKEQGLLRDLLSFAKYVNHQLNCLSDAKNGVHEILCGEYDICLIDYHLGNDEGLNLIHTIRDNGVVTPLVLLMNEENTEIETKALKAGAVDYLHKKEINSQLLERVIRYAIERKQNEDEVIKINKQLKYLATNDVLTGIGNRNQFIHTLPLVVEHCIRNKQTIAIISLDLDQFKQVNDTFGHKFGDLLLQQAATRLKGNLRKIDNIFRLGGDEFIIIIDGDINKTKVTQLVLKIIAIFSTPFTLNEQKCQISTSIGITMARYDEMHSPEQLTKEADIALYSAKKKGRNNFQFYQPAFLDEFLQYSHLTVDLQQALANKELTLNFQPLVSFVTNKIIGVEALLRWQHPTLGNIPPVVFIPISEKNGLIIPIGEWALRQACLQKKIWEDMGYSSLLMAVNISILQLQQPNFVEMVTRIMQESGVDSAGMEIEISESAITTNFQDCSSKMAALKTKNIRFVIDDFGTGYSNLGYLKHFPFDKIKIDKIFIDEITTGNNEQYIVEAIINMAKKMGLEVVAEGVETAEQVNYLRLHHSDQVQGFYYSEPLSAEECTRFLQKGLEIIIPAA